MSSLRKTSLFLYRELMMSFIILLTSAWKACFSAESLICLTSATLSPSILMASASLSTVSVSVLDPSL